MMEPVDSARRAWRAQFDKQLTAEAMERVIKATEGLLRRVARHSAWRDSQNPDDRLHAVIVDTLAGTLRWDPERVDLERFLVGAIRSDIAHELGHADRFRHVSLDDEGCDLEALEADASAAIADARIGKNELPMHALWPRVMAALRAEAAEDIGMLAVLHAFDHGRVTRREVMDFAGLSSKQFHAAFQRLLRAAEHVDDDVRDLVFRAIA